MLRLGIANSALHSAPAREQVVAFSLRQIWTWAVVSAVDRGHVGLVVSPAGGGLERVVPLELVDGEIDVRGGGVFLDACDATGARDGSDVVTPVRSRPARSGRE
jgi:hypothetical protein